MKDVQNAETFEEFNRILAEFLQPSEISSIHIEYKRQENVLCQFEEWMKTNLDKFGITEMQYWYQNGELTFVINPMESLKNRN
jgi:hypothetical protein